MDAFDGFRRRALPALAVLVALGAGACDDDIPPPFTVEGTGAVEGLLFLDANDDQLFDPSDGDQALGDVQVAALVRGTMDVLATGSTDAQGRFLIQGLPAGTHDLLVDPASVPEGAVVCQNPFPATVFIDETSFTDIAARTACLVSIAEVQESAEEGEFVVVRGIVTAFPGQFDEGDAAIQDETGGIWLFDTSIEGMGVEVGDLVEVGGTVSLAVQALQLEDVELEIIEKGVGAPAPVEVTTGEIAAASDPRDPLQNVLVTVRAAELLTPFESGGSRNASIDDGSGSTVMRVESGISDSGSAILETLGMEVGNCYDITGIVGAFFGTAQIFPRSVADVVEVPCGG